MNKIYVTDENELDIFYEDNALTFIDVIEDEIPLYLDFIKQYTPLKKEDVYVFNGKLMNDKYQLTGDNRYFDNLTFICIKLEDIENVGKFAIPRFQIGGRWFNDVVDNNTRRELEND